ncbi:MAG: arsenite efflux transporter metallochaperone ArsD [Clostridia bacterium]
MQVRVFDPEMCCASGVCGPAPDPALIGFQQVVERLKAEGADVQRYQLSRQPQAFVGMPHVYQLLLQRGTSALPVVTVDGQIASSGAYPTYEQLKAPRSMATTGAVAGKQTGCG